MSSVLWNKGPLALHRRHLEVIGKSQPTKAQLKAAAKDILGFRDSGNWGMGDLMVLAKSLGAEDPVNEVIEEVVRDRHSARKLFYVSSAIAPEARIHELWWTFYYAVYTFPADARDRLLALAAEQHWSFDEFKKHLRDLRHTVRQKTAQFPEGKFGVIYIDPPWQYDEGSIDPSRQIENQYPTMPLEEMMAFTDSTGRGLGELAAPDCVMYMWATAPKTAEAITLGESMGFEYKSGAVWDKEFMGPGYYFRIRHELLLVFTKGKPIVPAEDVRGDSIFRAKPDTDEHSSKPNAYVCDMLETQYPHAPKIEIFARLNRPGWSSFGNELPTPDADAGEPLEAGAEQAQREEERETPAGKKKAAKALKGNGAAKKAKSKKKDPMAPRLVKGNKSKRAAAAAG